MYIIFIYKKTRKSRTRLSNKTRMDKIVYFQKIIFRSLRIRVIIVVVHKYDMCIVVCFAVLVRRLRQLQEEPRTVLPTPAVAGAGRRKFAATAKRDRPRRRQGGRKGRAVRGEPDGGRRPTASPSAIRRQQVGRGRTRQRTATGTVLSARPEPGNDRRPRQGHIRRRQNRGGVRDGLPAETVAVGHWPQHNDR